MSDAPIVKSVSTAIKKQREEQIHELAAEVVSSAFQTIADAQYWAAMDWGSYSPENPPQEWIEELGLAGAKIRARRARAAWEASKDAPVGLKMALDVVRGAMSSGQVTNVTQQTLNVAVKVIPTAQEFIYPSREVEK